MDPFKLLKIVYTVSEDSIKLLLDSFDTYYGSFYRYIRGGDREVYRNCMIKLLTKIIPSLKYKVSLHLKRVNNNKIDLTNISYLDLVDLYLEYLDWLNNNMDINKYPLEFIILDKNKVILYEGIHRFIICLSKNIKCNYIIKESKYPVYDNIIGILMDDSKKIYKSDKLILYNPIDHILFDKYDVIRDDRREIVKNVLNKLNVKTGLEIGTQNGNMSFYLQKNGYDMTAIEYEKKYFNLCNNIAEFTDNKGVKFVNIDIYNYELGKYDFVVGLSIFYHLYRNNKTSCGKLIQKLKKCTKYVILDDEPNTKILTSDIISNLFNDCIIDPIYKGKDNRTIYLVSI